MNYWEVDGGFSNPALILLDKYGGVIKVIHVYKVGEGEVEGVQSAETLYADLKAPALLRQFQALSPILHPFPQLGRPPDGRSPPLACSSWVS